MSFPTKPKSSTSEAGAASVDLPAVLLEKARTALSDEVFSEKFRKCFNQKITTENINLSRAMMINRAYEIYIRCADPTLVFHKKSQGITSGFIVTGEKIGKLYVKNFLGMGRSDVVELFTYELLQRLGFGAEIDAHHCDGYLPFMASHDLSAKGEEFILGGGAMQLLSANSEKYKGRVIAVEILLRALGLGDIRHNLENFGVVVKGEELCLYIIDFHHNPPAGHLGRQGSALTQSGLDKRLGHGQKSTEALFAPTTVFAKTGVSEEVYGEALEMLNPGRVEEAIEFSLGLCRAFTEKIKIVDERLASSFALASLEKYVAEVRENFGKLGMATTQSRRESVQSFLSGSGSYVDFDFTEDFGRRLSSTALEPEGKALAAEEQKKR